MLCTNGHENIEGSKFCIECGALIITEIQPDQESPLGNPSAGTNSGGVSQSQQSAVSNRSIIGILLSLLLGAVGGIFGIILGKKSLKEIDSSGGKLTGRGAAITSFVLGILSIVWTIIIILVLVLTLTPSSSSSSNSSGSGYDSGSASTHVDSTYTINWLDTVFGYSCADVYSNFQFNGNTPVRVYGSDGTQVASGVIDSGTDNPQANSKGDTVPACDYTAEISGIPKGLGTYTIADFGSSYADALSYKESEIASDNAAEERNNR
jgi:hypothetical protein